MRQIAKTLLEIKAVSLSPSKPFTYASGRKGPIYCDNRLLLSYPEKRRMVANAFSREIKKNNLRADVIAGTATAGIPWAALIAEKLKKPMIYVRAASKQHGKKGQIEGKLDRGKKVLVIEDLINTGSSSIEVIKAIRSAGGKVNDCIAIFDYQLDDAKNNFKNAKCRLYSLTNLSELLSASKLSRKEKKLVKDWQKNPLSWG